MAGFRVWKDGKPYSVRFEHENQADKFLMVVQSNSYDHATRFEGWSVRTADGGEALELATDLAAIGRADLFTTPLTRGDRYMVYVGTVAFTVYPNGAVKLGKVEVSPDVARGAARVLAEGNLHGAWLAEMNTRMALRAGPTPSVGMNVQSEHG